MTANVSYFIIMAAGLILSFSLYSVRLRRRKLPAGLGWTTLFFSLPLGYFFAKLIFLIVRFKATVAVHGLAAFIRVLPEEFSFVGGALGVVLAVVMCAKLRRLSVPQALDAFAPAGCLLAAFARAAEYFLGTVGWGDYLEVDLLCRFPFAVQNRYGEWFLAVFTFEACIALILFVLSFIREGSYRTQPGLLFGHTAYSLCICQVIPEMLRAVTIIYSFVRTEQLICALAAFGLLWRGCVLLSRRGKKGAYRPLVWMLLLAGLNIALQFALDKPYLFIDPLPLSEGARTWLMANSADVFYGIMVADVALMLLLAWRTAHALAARGGKKSRA